MKVNVVFHPKFSRYEQLASAVSQLNAVQTKVRFNLISSEQVPEYDREQLEPIQARQAFFRDNPTILNSILVTERGFTDNWFSHTASSGTIATTFDWERYYAPPSLRTFLQTEMVTHVVARAADLTDELTSAQAHVETVGCLFDLCVQKSDIKLKMISGCICGTCRAALASHGAETAYLDAADTMLDAIRLSAIGRLKSVDPNRIFVAMRFTSNDENGNSYEYGVKPAIETDLGMKALRADSVAGNDSLISKVFRLIDGAKHTLIIAGEDNLNVYFEYGYALGKSKPVFVVVRADKLSSLPTDVKGFEYIVYEPGNFGQLRKRLADALRGD